MKRLNDYKAGIWAFFVAVAFYPGIMSAALVPRWCIIAIGVPLIGEITFKHIDRLVAYALVGALGWAAMSLVISPDRMGGELELFFMVMLCGVALVSSQLKTLDHAMMGAALGICVSSALCALKVLGLPVVEEATTSPAGLFYNSEVLAEFVAPVLVWALVSRRWTLSAVLALSLVWSGSRVAALAIAIALLYVYRPRSNLALAALVIAVIVGGFSALLMFGQGSGGHRIVIWLATLMAVTPLGAGLGWFQAAHPIEQFAHSDVIQAMAEFGIGAAFAAAIPVLILVRNRGNHAERAAFIAILVECLVSFPLHVPAAAFLAALLAGYLAGGGSGLRGIESIGGNVDRENPQRNSAGTRRIDSASGVGAYFVPVRSEAA